MSLGLKYGAAAFWGVLATAGPLPLAAQDSDIRAGAGAVLPEPETKPLAIDFSNDPVLGLADATAEPDTFRTIVVAALEQSPVDRELRARENVARADDILIGGAGNDLIYGHSGADTFVFAEYGTVFFDNLVDFSGVDTIALDTSVFDIAAGALDASVFVHGSDAQDWDDRIIYDQTTGELWYDADGIGGVQKKLIAVLDNNFALQASHIEGFDPAPNAEPLKPMLEDLAMVDQVVV